MTVIVRESFKLKLCLWIVAVALAVFSLIFFVSLNYSVDEVRKSVRATVDSKLDYAIQSLDNGVASVQIAASNVVGVFNSPLMDVRRDSVVRVCRRFLEGNPHIQGVAIGFEPGAAEGHKDGYAPYLFHDLKTDKYVERDLARSKKYREDEWYKEAHDLKQPCWSKPFVESNGTLIVSYNVPLMENGEVYAVAAFDINLTNMSERLQRLKPYPNAMFTIIGSDGTFLAHPNPDYIFSESVQSLVEKATFAPNQEVLDQMMRGERGMGVYNNGKEDMYIYFAPANRIKWGVSMEVPYSDLAEGLDRMFEAMLFNMLIGLALLVVVCLVVISRLTRPLEAFAQAAQHISHGEFHTKLPVVTEHNELYDLRQALETMGTSLDRYMKDLEESTKSKALIEGELNIARKIQLAMVPKIFPPYPERKDIDIYASLTSAKAVGGDLYDFLLEGDDIYFCIGDVSGKGVPASLFMAITRSLFRNIVVHAKSPALIAKTLNNAIAQNNEQNMFVTMFIGRANLVTGELTCCNCGHNAPATNGTVAGVNPLRIVPGGTCHLMSTVPCNLPVGLIEGFEYEEVNMHIEKGVKMFLYTDGVTEAENKEKQLYGEERMLAMLTKVGDEGTSEQYVKSLVDDVHEFTEGAEQSDDITMLCFCYNKR